MESRVVRKDGVVIILPSGELDVHTSARLMEMIGEEIGRGTLKMLINLEAVEYVDSSALAVLVSGLKMMRNQNGRFKLCNAHGPVERVFDVTRLSKFFEIYGNESEALASFENY